MRKQLGVAVWMTMALLGVAACGDDGGDADDAIEQTDGGGTTAPAEDASGSEAEADTDDAASGDAASDDAGSDESAGSGDIDVDAIRDDPCSLVTQEEAASILGKPIEAPEEGTAVGTVEATCAYSVETDRPSEVMVVTVSLMFTPDRVEGDRDGAAYMVNARKGVEAQELSGLGDEAFCVVQGAFATAFARVGDVVLSTGSDTCESAQQFATRAVSRL